MYLLFTIKYVFIIHDSIGYFKKEKLYKFIIPDLVNFYKKHNLSLFIITDNLKKRNGSSAIPF